MQLKANILAVATFASAAIGLTSCDKVPETRVYEVGSKFVGVEQDSLVAKKYQTNMWLVNKADSSVVETNDYGTDTVTKPFSQLDAYAQGIAHDGMAGLRKLERNRNRTSVYLHRPERYAMPQ